MIPNLPPVLFSDYSNLIHEILQRHRLLGEDDLEALVLRSAETGMPIAEAAVVSGTVEREALLRLVADHVGLRFHAAVPAAVPLRLRDRIPVCLARDLGVVAIEESSGRLVVLAVDPLNPHLVDDLTFALEQDIEVVLADPIEVKHLLDDTFGEDGLVQVAINAVAGDRPRELPSILPAAIVTEGPVTDYVGTMLRRAVCEGASDIHFEPFEGAVRVRCRVDGTLREAGSAPVALGQAIVARIKVLADLNVAESRVPQDGRIQMSVDGRAVDLRVSTLPTQFGESVVVRILDKSVVNLNLDALGMPPGILTEVRALARLPNGIFIVTGPTGSGKTTTLISALREVNDEELKILTAEDPVEYEIDGVTQVAIKPDIGLTFASALRGFLRQDPDKILVGEIRDFETARIAVQASLTGHLVFTTLHTNNAPGAVVRLVDLGLEPYLIASALEGVLAQRLLRRICRGCLEVYEPSREVLRRLGAEEVAMEGTTFAKGRGCTACGNSGYRGRIGLFEMIRVTDRFREGIIARKNALQLAALACEDGMSTLRQDGMRALRSHATTVEEVLRYT